MAEEIKWSSWANLPAATFHIHAALLGKIKILLDFLVAFSEEYILLVLGAQIKVILDYIDASEIRFQFGHLLCERYLLSTTSQPLTAGTRCCLAAVEKNVSNSASRSVERRASGQ